LCLGRATLNPAAGFPASYSDSESLQRRGMTTFTPPAALVYRSQRGRTSLTWSLVLEPADSEPGRTRVFLRLRMAPVRHKLLARTAGELIDLLTVAGMAAGLAERLRGHNGAT
jgi:hypothetical protein